MSAKNYITSNRSMSQTSRNKSYAAINILWNQMRPDLRFEDKETIREERLTWIKDFLNLKKLESTTILTDKQIGLVLDEMKRMTGQPIKKPLVAPKPQTWARSGIVGFVKTNSDGETEIVHTASPEQLYVLDILENHLGWTDQQRENYLKPRFHKTSFRALEFKQANSLTMQMLTIAAQKELKLIVKSGTKISREQIRKYIPVLKQKLGIDR